MDIENYSYSAYLDYITVFENWNVNDDLDSVHVIHNFLICQIYVSLEYVTDIC